MKSPAFQGMLTTRPLLPPPCAPLGHESTLTGIESPWSIQSDHGLSTIPALVIAWSAVQPERVGEVAFVPLDGSARLLGRGPQLEDDQHSRLFFSPQRPAEIHRGAELLGPSISRRQALLAIAEGKILVTKTGSCPMKINGTGVTEGQLGDGDTLTLQDQLVLLCVRRPLTIAPTQSYPKGRAGRFGAPDADGIVGESPAMWKLRDDIAFLSRADGHVLVLGESGVGKEITAHAIHGLCERASNPIVARSAATIPDTLIDAELFGNVGNYPNPGMQDRPGLIGEADGSTLFLDEIGELPPPLQARLLRVLDSEGEYSRLGEARSRKADIRLRLQPLYKSA